MIPPIQSTEYGINSLIFRGSMLWNTVPSNIKQSKSISCIKKNIKSWLGDLCGCSICRDYLFSHLYLLTFNFIIFTGVLISSYKINYL